ncbi:hypothetical protein HPB51_005637 [Rhipicephalus microplus]|uniref:Uncharacterized protein n=1 Tax=Rhipicephalus microplus TaxID=6941 RepID=A0A9J6ELX8_RHIMP|nr:hypothetical protein HPB51_005637 [Rhipicephalus microplus]
MRIVQRELEAAFPAANKPTFLDASTPAVSLIQAVVRQEFANLGILSTAPTMDNTNPSIASVDMTSRRPYSFRTRNPSDWRTADGRSKKAELELEKSPSGAATYLEQSEATLLGTDKGEQELSAGLTSAGYVEKDIANFFALRPVALWKNLPLFARLLEALDGLVRFIILLSISAPRSSCVVEATTAWNNTTGCFISDGMQPTVEDCLQLITAVPKPKSQFALTLTLRMDVFVDVDYTRQADEQARTKNNDVGKGCRAHRHRFVEERVCPPAEEAKSASTSFGTTAECKFVISMSQNERRVETFETPASIERVMVRAYQSLGEKNHGKLSWFLYNVTSYVATGPCPRGQTRIDKVREVLERYRRKTGSRS